MRVCVVTESIREYPYNTNILRVFNADTTSMYDIKEFIYNYLKEDCFGGDEPNKIYFCNGAYDDGNISVDYIIDEIW